MNETRREKDRSIQTFGFIQEAIRRTETWKTNKPKMVEEMRKRGFKKKDHERLATFMANELYVLHNSDLRMQKVSRLVRIAKENRRSSPRTMDLVKKATQDDTCGSYLAESIVIDLLKEHKDPVIALKALK